MNWRSILPWSLLAIWATWGYALSFELAAAGLGSWAPDLGCALLAALAVSVRTRKLPLLALVFALARSAVSIDSPLANLAACLAFVGGARALRGVFDILRPTPLALSTAFGALTLEAWFAWIGGLRVDEHFTRVGLEGSARASWLAQVGHAAPGALITALAVFAFAPLLRRLPGLPALEGAKPWPAAASLR